MEGQKPTAEESLERGRFEGKVLNELGNIKSAIASFHDKHKDIYKHIDDVVAVIRKEIASNKAESDAKHLNHDNRLDGLEKWRWWLMGAFAVVAFVVNILSGLITKLVENQF